MLGSEPLFSAAERRAAVVALVLTVLVTVVGLTVWQSLSPPSLGPYGADTYSVAASPGILDARPITSTPNS